jgi:hypothetical protein
MKLWILLLLTAGLVAGCQTAAQVDKTVSTRPRFFMESSATSSTTVILPRSGVPIAINPKPVFTEADVMDVELVQVELGQCLMFRLTSSAARDLYRMSGTNQGRRLVLLLDGEPMGARRMDGALNSGVLFIFVELPDETLPGLVGRLKASVGAVQRALARKS